MSTSPPLLGGLLPLEPELDSRWSDAGAWQMPVGARYELGGNGVSPPFKENRGTEGGRRRVTHQGTDLANGLAGDTVRAAGSGVVIVAFDGDNGNGYGGHVVLAHRIPVDRVVYTVYGHLGRGTVAVKPGDLVIAGDPIGRVGQTGRASTPHLHFEVREGDDPFARWENAHVIEPLPFLYARLPGQREEPGPDRAYAEWAEYEGLIAGHLDPTAPLTRADWWRILSRAVEDGPTPTLPGAHLRDSLIEHGVLPEEEAGASSQDRLGWEECARDVKRLHVIGVRMAHGPLPEPAHQAECESRFEHRSPSAHTGVLRRRSNDPTLGDVCVLLADLAGPAPEVQLKSATPGRAKQAKVAKGKRTSRTRATTAKQAASKKKKRR
ncbi:MAG: M23 family metallopeptidase [Candidatus Eisenbacteria bacterium]|uniref:M23 family metallopeptidase n=1 Tax=Eiseniibacteriota bacterium TaxID=2212470 RepID=A0A933W9R1_UNCEI|nr:M23 family metallopeptidase [Candidatus Eisenbacteria bacterium]